MLYHEPSPDDLRRQLRYLSRCYTLITLDRLVDAIYSQDWSQLPRKGLVITLDDGHRANARLLEVFQEFGVEPTIYLCSQVVGTNRHYWWLEAGPERDALKSVPSRTMRVLLERRHGFSFTREYYSRQALSRKELKRMSRHVSFQSHSRFHRVLPLALADEREEEILLSRKEVEDLTGAPCCHFSFPNGTYSNEDVELVMRAGYRSARTTDLGWNDLRTDPYRLKIAGAPEWGGANAAASCLIRMYLQLALRGSFRGRYRERPQRLYGRPASPSELTEAAA